jgi:branched-chain amino acid transport system substrate-binding protein
MAGKTCTTRNREFVIGGIFSLTGYLSWVGTCKKRAAELRTEIINQAGGINGRPVRLIACDDRSSPGLAARTAERLITHQRVSAIIGTSSLTISSAIASVANVYQVPAIISSVFDIDHDKHLFVFNTALRSETVAERSFSWLRAMGISSIALLMPVNLMGELGTALGNKLSEKYGIRVLLQENFNPNGCNIKTHLRRIRAHGPQAIFAYVTGQPAAHIAWSMASLNMNVPLIVSHGNANASFLNAVSRLPVPLIVPSGQTMLPDAIPKDDPSRVLVARFNENHVRRYGEPFDYCAAACCDALDLAAEGFRIARSPRGPDLREAMETIASFEGMEGVYSFSPDDHYGRPFERMVLLQLRNGEWSSDKTQHAESAYPKGKPARTARVVRQLNRWLSVEGSLPVLPVEPFRSGKDAHFDPYFMTRLHHERECNMVTALRTGDTTKVKELLSQLTSLLLSCHIDRPDLLKLWATEIISTLCQTLIEGKAEFQTITRIKLDAISKVAMAESPQAVCLDFLMAVQKLLRGVGTQGITSTHRVLRKALAFIEKNYNTPLTVNQIAGAVSLSASHLSHVIKKERSLTLGKCIAQVRIEKAKQLLRNSDLPICQIAMEVGYPDQSYFTKIFKKYEKITPAEYRRHCEEQCGPGT